MPETLARSAAQLLIERFGTTAFPRQNPEGNSLGTTAATILRRNANRLGFLFINLSLNVMYLRPRNPASAGAGIRVDPNGGAFRTAWFEDFDMPCEEWSGIADAAASTYFLIELVTV